VTDPLTTFPDAELVDLDRQLRSSLPLSYAPSPRAEDADIVLVSGASDWPERVESRLNAGAKGVVTIDPRPADADRVRALGSVAGSVVLSESYASHPAVASIKETLDGSDTLVVSAYGERPAAQLLFDQLRLLRSLDVAELRPLDVLNNGSSVLVTMSGMRAGETVLVRLFAATTKARTPRVVVRAYGPGTLVSATLPGPDTARAATVEVSTPATTVAVATSPEIAHRAVLRQVRMGAADSDLAGFAADITLLEQLH
jgi:hypothetical protein